MQKFNLYIKNFPADSTEEELKEYFAQFGEVKNVRIMRRGHEIMKEEEKMLEG